MNREIVSRPKLKTQVTFGEVSDNMGEPERTFERTVSRDSGDVGGRYELNGKEGNDGKRRGERDKRRRELEHQTSRANGDRDRYKDDDRDRRSKDDDRDRRSKDDDRKDDDRDRRSKDDDRDRRSKDDDRDRRSKDDDRDRRSKDDDRDRRYKDEDRERRYKDEDRERRHKDDERDRRPKDEDKDRRYKDEDRERRSKDSDRDRRSKDEDRDRSTKYKGEDKERRSKDSDLKDDQDKEKRSSRSRDESDYRSSKRHVDDRQSSKYESDSRREDRREYREYREQKDSRENRDSRTSDPEKRRAIKSKGSSDEDTSSLVDSVKSINLAAEEQPIPVVEPVAPKTAAKKKFASKMRSIVSAVKTAQLLEKSRHNTTSATFVPKYAKEDIVRTGHMEYDTLYASNERETGELTVNSINAPNESTLQCGCENINCPFCNLMMSIGSTEPSLLQ
ncbi:serine/threonine-protein kinase fray2 [Eurytemora carolleeae]|uniref:serine/threonine-protein kinase fray2 n=1 Tax=Eurytemora carolleeae TaxID=1294199 RepID=UPI000C78BA5D|nr:serine/threonine-protein kinase fray2 [Eurytemora carolleeae]|eukprot:XP_023320127.1 serine/threonine-protein kinase fray2-like [Eurytemora affinis]